MKKSKLTNQDLINVLKVANPTNKRSCFLNFGEPDNLQSNVPYLINLLSHKNRKTNAPLHTHTHADPQTHTHTHTLYSHTYSHLLKYHVQGGWRYLQIILILAYHWSFVLYDILFYWRYSLFLLISKSIFLYCQRQNNRKYNFSTSYPCSPDHGLRFLFRE